MKPFETQEPGEALKMLRSKAAARSLAQGTHRIDYRCLHCRSTAIVDDKRGSFDCMTCGRSSWKKDVETARVDEILKFLRDGIDILPI